MKRGGNGGGRFWTAAVLLLLCAAGSAQKLFRTHFATEIPEPRYEFKATIPACRGAIFDSGGKSCPLVKSVPYWEFHLDPVALTNSVVIPRNEKLPRKREAICKTIADALKLDYSKVLAMSENTRNRYQYLGRTSDPEVYKILGDSRLVAGLAIEQKQVRQYFQNRRMCHIIGALRKDGKGIAGLELKYDKELSGVPGKMRGLRDGRGRKLYDKRIEEIRPIPGADIRLTIDLNLQFEVETALKDGIEEFHAGSGWCVVLDVQTGAVLAMASFPDFNPLLYGHSEPTARINRPTNFSYEPGSVMKVITAAAALDCGLVSPDTRYTTNRDDERYFRLPGDGRHVWEPTMTVRDAIVHSSNIVIGKLGYDLGPRRLYDYMKAFGLGAKTGIEAPGETAGVLPPWEKWDKVKWSRAPIGQGVGVSAIQLASAYQAIANDGVRMRPHLVSEITAADGHQIYKAPIEVVSRPIRRETSRKIREMMLGVASREGTARRAAIRGYSVAGKTGTAQKLVGKKYSDKLYRATFCGIVPSGVEFRDESDSTPAESRIVVLVTLDFDTFEKYHQGGNSAAPVFKRIATAALRYLEVEPDRPEELLEYEDDGELDRIMEARELENATAEDDD